MSGKNTILKSFALADTKKGIISVSHLEEPYGAKSAPVVSIGISLKGNENEPDWKAHIPYENLDELIASLQEAKEKYGK
ncbi:MAG: hypothetical protein CR967_05770 [Proteobacteria bacterium]|nr:MAG: hypothetical protein CR967_05770 [Pseudomonadota bacterium]